MECLIWLCDGGKYEARKSLLAGFDTVPHSCYGDSIVQTTNTLIRSRKGVAAKAEVVRKPSASTKLF